MTRQPAPDRTQEIPIAVAAAFSATTIFYFGWLRLPLFCDLYGPSWLLREWSREFYGPKAFDPLSLEVAAAYLFAVIPVLVLAHIRGVPRSLAMVAGALSALAAAWLFHLFKSAPLLRELRESAPPGALPDPWLPLPWAAVTFRSVSRLWIPLVAAAWLTGPPLRAARLVPAVFVGMLIFDFAYNGRLPVTPEPWAGCAILTSAMTFPFLVPAGRAALAKLMGFPPEAPPEGEPRHTPTPGGASFAFRLTAAAILAGLLMPVPGGVLLGWIERRAEAVIAGGAGGPPRGAGFVNAYPMLEGAFAPLAEGEEPNRVPFDWDKIPNGFGGSILPAHAPPRVVEMAIRKAPASEMAAYFAYYDQGIRAIEAARDADYLEFPPGEGFHKGFIATRATVRALAFRSVVRLTEGRPAEAARDIDSILRFAAILREGPGMVQYMLGTAFLRIGVSAAYAYCLWNRESPENLALLMHAFDRAHPLIREPYPYAALRVTDPGYWIVAPFVEYTAPRLGPASRLTQLLLLEFEIMRAALKLELHRHYRGAYPASLAALIPDFMERIPVDPESGRPLDYKKLGAEFDLGSPAYGALRHAKDPPKNPLPFPYSEVEDPKLERRIAKWNPESDDPE